MELPDLLDKLLFPTPEVIAIFDVIFIVLTAIAFTAALAFAVSYGFFFRWRKRPAGKAQMYIVLALAAVFGVVLLARVLGPLYPGRLLLTSIVYLAVPVTLIRLLVALWRRYHPTPQPHERMPRSDLPDENTQPRR